MEKRNDRQPETHQAEREERQSIWTRRPVVFLTAFFCCALWGSASPAIKIGYRLFQVGADDTPARILFAGIRFAIAGLMVIVFESFRRRSLIHPRKETWRYVLCLSAVQTVLQYLFFYMGLAHTTGVRGSVLNASATFFSLLLAVYVFHFEKMTVRKVAGSVLGFAGVVLMVTGGSLEGMGGKVSLQGEGAVLLAAFSSSVAGCLIKRYSKYEDPVVLSGWQFLLGGSAMTLAGLAAGGRLTVTSPACVPLILYMGFISAGAYTLWGILLASNPVSTVTVLGFMNPVMGVLLSALFLGEGREAFSIVTVWALVLVTAGILIVNRNGGARKNRM